MTSLRLPSNKKAKTLFLLLLNTVYENGLAAEDNDQDYIPINRFSTEQIINIMVAETTETRPMIVRKIQSLEAGGFLKYKFLTVEGAIWILKITDDSDNLLEWDDIRSFVSTGTITE